MSICDELEELIPAYALGTLDASESAFVKKHLRDCPDLRDQFASYEDVAARLVHAATPSEPSRALKYRVLAAASPQPRHEFSLPSAVAGFARSPALIALALIVAIGLGIWNISTQNQLSQQLMQDQKLIAQLVRERDQVSAVMAYGQGQPRELKGTEIASHSSGRLYSKSDQVTFMLSVHNLPPLEPGKVYQLWLVDSKGDRTSGGTFTLDGEGYGWLVLRPPRPLNEYTGIGITVEPDGGSPAPTGPRVMGTSL